MSDVKHTANEQLAVLKGLATYALISAAVVILKWSRENGQSIAVLPTSYQCDTILCLSYLAAFRTSLVLQRTGDSSVAIAECVPSAPD